MVVCLRDYANVGKFATSPYYKQSIEALKQHQLACKLLGEPLRFQTLKLGNKQNWVTTEEAHVRMLTTLQTSLI